MKLILALIVSAVILTGCHKDGEVTPKISTNGQSGSSTGSSGTSGTSGGSGGSVKTPPDSVSKYSHDDSIHFATFRVGPQPVKSSVTGSKLTLVYNENVNLLFSLTAYQHTSAVHLHEDFSQSMLAGFDFTTVAEGGNITLNWVDDNLNNVILKSVADTMINSKQWVRINVHRVFTFYKAYSSSQDALDQQAAFVKKTSDMVMFNSYCYYNQKNYAPVTVPAGLVYK